MSTDSTPGTGNDDDKVQGREDEIQERSGDELREMSDRVDARPEPNTDGDLESDPE